MFINGRSYLSCSRLHQNCGSSVTLPLGSPKCAIYDDALEVILEMFEPNPLRGRRSGGESCRRINLVQLRYVSKVIAIVCEAYEKLTYGSRAPAKASGVSGSRGSAGTRPSPGHCEPTGRRRPAPGGSRSYPRSPGTARTP